MHFHTRRVNYIKKRQKPIIKYFFQEKVMENFNIIPYQCGRFVSRGRGSHMLRTIATNELVFCVKGVLRMFEEDNIFELHPGDYYILRKGRIHGGTEKYPAGLTFFWLHFDCDEQLLDEIPQSGHAARAEQLAIYIQSYLAEQSLPEPDTKILKHLLCIIIHELKRSRSGSNLRSVPELVRKAAAYARIHFAEPVSINDAAAEMHCSSEYLGRIFHRHFQETFSTVLNNFRAEYAAKLLIESNLSVKEIISECGFNDPAYFRRIFYRRYAASPTAFRKFHNSGHSNTD